MPNLFNISIITTGGTIEKTYNEQDGSLANRGTILKNKILSKMRLPHTHIEVFPLMNKDSLYMTEEDRELIFKTISEHLKQNIPIVVLHGTDTMTLTAEYCYKRLKAPSVPIIFTGAMIPLGFDDSDATQNVIEALLAARMLTAGLYISFHNHIFKVPHVQKNKERGTFEEMD